jgi:hypothetical protein
MSEVRYIERDQDGNVVAIYACPQASIPTEEIAEDHPDLTAYYEDSAVARRRRLPIVVMRVDVEKGPVRV